MALLFGAAGASCAWTAVTAVEPAPAARADTTAARIFVFRLITSSYLSLRFHCGRQPSRPRRSASSFCFVRCGFAPAAYGCPQRPYDATHAGCRLESPSDASRIGQCGRTAPRRVNSNAVSVTQLVCLDWCCIAKPLEIICCFYV